MKLIDIEERLEMDIQKEKRNLESGIRFLRRTCDNIEIHIKEELPSLNSLGEIQGLGNSIDVSVSRLSTLVYLKKEILDQR